MIENGKKVVVDGEFFSRVNADLNRGQPTLGDLVHSMADMVREQREQRQQKAETAKKLRELFEQIDIAKIACRWLMEDQPEEERADWQWIDRLHDGLYGAGSAYRTLKRLEAEAEAEAEKEAA
jgi:hypothetical protein